MSDTLAPPRAHSVIFPPLGGNMHLDGLLARFGNVALPPDSLPCVQRVLVLCFTNRTGSNYLATALASSGQLNVAREMFDVDVVDEFARGATSFSQFLNAAVTRQAVGGVWAVKAGISHLGVMAACGLLDTWRNRLRFVSVERGDKLGQAISWTIAVQTGEWYAGYAGRNGREPRYDRRTILQAIDAFADGNRHFDRFFALNGIVPLHVTYEDLDAAPAETVARVGRYAGLNLPLIPERVGLRRQANARNQEWRRRFLAGE